ncbi:MAG TPA: hypothetical protein PLN21_02810 [Gemmatales bacterium]|nr:hypothetical protein [Gemmatales bacterium]
MQRRHVWWTSLLFATGIVPCAVAQVPAGAAAAATAAAPGVIAAAPQQTLCSWLGCSWEQKEECRRMLCKLPIGQMLNNATAPLGLLTGGIIPGFCPPASAELLKEDGAKGTAAKIKADEADAKERRAAVRYLGTVDCHYWPEAQDALIASLRGDRNECVRFEAALALGNGCCCTKKTIEALINATTCSNKDDFPRETSARVQAAARQALDHCLCCFQDMNPAPVEDIKAPPEKSKGNKAEPGAEKSGGDKQKSSTNEPRKLGEATPFERPTKMTYYARINEQPMELIVREGRRVLSATQPMPVTGSNSFAKLIDRSSGVPETRGYIVQGGQPGQTAEVVTTSKPTNLWDLMTGGNKPVIVSSYPAKSTVVQAAEPTRVVPQANTKTVVQATTMPQSTAAAAGTISGPAMPTVPAVQPPPQMPVLKSSPVPVVSLPPTPAPRVTESVTSVAVTAPKAPEMKTAPTLQSIQPAVPTSVSTTPAAPSAKVVETKTAPTIQPVQSSTPATTAPASLTPPVVKVEVKTAPAVQPIQASAPAPVATKPAAVVTTAPAKPVVSPMQNVMQKISMGNVQERFTALESLSAVHKASPELSAQLIKTAEQDSSEQVRCAAIRAMVRTGVPANQSIPVLAQLGMDVESKVGKEANQALAQINLQLTGESK